MPARDKKGEERGLFLKSSSLGTPDYMSTATDFFVRDVIKSNTLYTAMAVYL